MIRNIKENIKSDISFSAGKENVFNISWEIISKNFYLQRYLFKISRNCESTKERNEISSR